MTNWQQLLDHDLAKIFLNDPELHAFAKANVASVEQLLRGIGPDDTTPAAGTGACIVFNMSAKHVPKFCEESANGDPHPYKNTYKLGRAGGRRQLVDEAVVKACVVATTLEVEEICFGAVETNGTGIRFFGDFCLVLRARPPWSSGIAAPLGVSDLGDLQVLERNSYDVVRAPIVERVRDDVSRGTDQVVARADEIEKWRGTWASDLIPMLTRRALTELPLIHRRWTTGHVAGAVLDDEDYCEVLYPRSFGAADVLEVRTNSNEAAAEGDIADRERQGEGPAIHELEWRQQRREARRALASFGVPLRVVTTYGRVKGA